MTMYRRATGRATGHIEQVNGENSSGPIVCQACSHLIFSSVNLGENNKCPYCHRDATKPIGGSRLASDNDDDSDVIAIPC